MCLYQGNMEFVGCTVDVDILTCVSPGIKNPPVPEKDGSIWRHY